MRFWLDIDRFEGFANRLAVRLGSRVDALLARRREGRVFIEHSGWTLGGDAWPAAVPVRVATRRNPVRR
jgi:hypothetical protein